MNAIKQCHQKVERGGSHHDGDNHLGLGSNQKNKGLISTDRNDKITLQRTTPCSKSQVVCKGFGSGVCREIAMRGRAGTAL